MELVESKVQRDGFSGRGWTDESVLGVLFKFNKLIFGTQRAKFLNLILVGYEFERTSIELFLMTFLNFSLS